MRMLLHHLLFYIEETHFESRFWSIDNLTMRDLFGAQNTCVQSFAAGDALYAQTIRGFIDWSIGVACPFFSKNLLKKIEKYGASALPSGNVFWRLAELDNITQHGCVRLERILKHIVLIFFWLKWIKQHLNRSWGFVRVLTDNTLH